MLSQNNWQEQLRKQAPKKQRFAIKKLTVGVASVLIGFTFMGVSASADSVSTTTPTSEATSTENNSTNNDQEIAKQVVLQSNTTDTQKPAEQTNTVNSDNDQSQDKNEDKGAATQTFDLAANQSKTAANQQATPVNTLNQQLYAVNNGVADVATFADFTKALCDKNVNTINMTDDITASDDQSALVSGGTGLTGANLLSPYELTPDKVDVPLISPSPYVGIAHDVTIQGNKHTLDMNKWTITLVNQNYDADHAWNITFKDMILKSQAQNQSYGPIYFMKPLTGMTSGIQRKVISDDDLNRSSLNFDNVTAVFDGTSVGASNVKTTFSGKNRINTTNVDTAVIAKSINVADGTTSINANSAQTAINTAGSVTVGQNASLNIQGGDGSELSKTKIYPSAGITTSQDAGNVKLAEGASLTIRAKDSGITTASVTTGSQAKLNVIGTVTGVQTKGFVQLGDNSTTTIKALGNDINTSTLVTGKNSTLNLLNETNTAMGNTGNNAVTFVNSVNIGQGSTVNVNTGDAQPPEDADTKDVRGFYSDYHGKSYINIGENAKVNMKMGSGHSQAMMASNLDIKDGAKVDISTMQDNNGELNYVTSAVKNSTTTYPDYDHYAPITLAYYSEGTLHIAKDASLKMVRSKCNGMVPMIAFGNATSGGDFFFLGSRNYTLTVDAGGSLDLQDAENSKGIQGYQWGETDNLGPVDDIFVPGMITMFGASSTDKITFGSVNEDNTMSAAKYINLQRTGLQRGNLIKLEGKAQPGGLLTSANIQNLTRVLGTAPIAQWNDANIGNAPSHIWVTAQIESQNGGGDTASNYVPINAEGVTADGFVKNGAILGLSFGNSSGLVQIPNYKTNDLSIYNNGQISGPYTDNLNDFLANFNWWKPRRIAFGTALYNNDAVVKLNDADKYEPVVNTLKKTEGDILTNSAFDNHQVVSSLTDPQYNVISTGLDGIIKDQFWGVDWTKTQFKNILNADGLPDADKVAALNNNDGKTNEQIFNDQTEYKAYQQFLKNIYYPDGKTRTTYDKAAFDKPLVSGNQNVTATIVYQDGTADTIAVPVEVAKRLQKDDYLPNYAPTEIKQGQNATVAAPKFEHKQITADGTVTYTDTTAPTGVTYAAGLDIPSFATVNSDGSISLKPTADTATGIYSIPVTVTYADKSTSTVNALVNVTDGNSNIIWGKKNPDGTVNGAVVVKSNPLTLHKTDAGSVSTTVDSLDAKSAISEIDVYTADKNDATKLVNTVYRYQKGDFKDADGNSIGSISVSYDDSASGLNTSQGDSATLPVNVTFNKGSVPATDNIVDNGAKTSFNQSVTLVGASAITPVKTISIPVGYDVTKDPEGYFTSDNLKAMVDHSDLDKLADNVAVKSYSIDPAKFDTNKAGDAKDFTIRITFKDSNAGTNSYLDVKIPNGVKVTTGEMAEYNPSYSSVTDTKQQAVTLTPSFTGDKPTAGVTYAIGQTSESDLPATMRQYVHVDPNSGIITVDQQAMADTASYVIPVIVTYHDGTTDNATAKVYEIKSAGTVTDPLSAEEGISHFEKLPVNTTFAWDKKPDPHTASEKINAIVTIPGQDPVKVPVTVTSSLALDPNNKTVVYGQDVITTINFDTPSYHKTSGDNTPDAPVVKSIDIKNNKGTTTYTLSSDGKTYSDDKGHSFNAGDIKTSWADGYSVNTNSSSFANNGAATTLAPTKDRQTSDEWDANKNSKYRVHITATGDAAQAMGLPDSDAGWANVYANFYGATTAKASAANNNLTVVQNGTLADPENYVDTTDLTAAHNAEVKNITWGTKPDLSKAGQITVNADINFTDGTKLTIPVTITVAESQANKFASANKDNALVQTISKGKGYVFKNTDAKDGIKEDPNNTYHIVWADKNNLKAPRFNDVTKIDTSKKSPATSYDATIYFEDGTKLDVKIPVVITDEATDNQSNISAKTYQVDPGGKVNPSDVITPNNNIPEGTTYNWGDKTPDTSKVGTQDVTVKVTYPDGTTSSVDSKVTVEATPEVGTVTLHQGVTPTAEDATSAITNLDPDGVDGMPKSVVWKAAPAVTNAGKSTATVTVTYNDGYTKDITVPVNVLKTTKGSDVTTPSEATHDIYREITRTITVDGATSIVQKVVFTRDKYTNSTDAAVKPTYSAWVAKDGKSAFAETSKLNKDGYTATATDSAGKTIALTDKGTIASQKVTVDSSNITITVTNTANDQTVTVKFINAKDGSTILVDKPKTLSGKTDSTVAISAKGITIPTGYKLDKNSDLPTSYKFTAANDQTITVKLDHLTTTDPSKVDQNDPKNADMFETITRTINYTDPITSQKHSDKQAVKFQRTKTVNDADSTDITYGDWTPVDSSKTAWDEYDVPQFTDYAVSAQDDAGNNVDVSKGTIASQNLEPGNGGKTKTADQTITLTYTMQESGEFKKANKDNALIKQLSWGKGTKHDASEAIDGVITKQDQTDYHVKGATFNTVPSTDEVHGAKNVEVTITFDDGSAATVQIPVAITDNAGNDTTITSKPVFVPVDPDQKPSLPDPKSGVDDPKAPKGTKYEWKDTPTVPDSGEKPASATVVVKYPDGTQKEISTTLTSDYKPVVAAITTPKDVAPDVVKGIANINKGKGYPTSVTWKTTPDVTKAGSIKGVATVSYDNGYTVDVEIPIKVAKNDSESYDPKPTIKPVPVPQDNKDIDPSSVVDSTTLPTDPDDKPTITWTDPTKKPDPTKPGTQPADVDITYPDGTVDHVKGHVTIEATPEIGSISTKQGQVPNLTDPEVAKKLVKNLNNGTDKQVDGYPTKVSWKTTPDVTKVGQTTGTIEVSYPDDYKITRDITITVTSPTGTDADKFTKDNGERNIFVHQLVWGKNTSHRANEAIDAINSDVKDKYHITSAVFTTDPSTDKVHDAQNFEAVVGFGDGAKATVQIPVAITDDAGSDATIKSKPVVISVEPGQKPALPDPKTGVDDPTAPTGTKYEWKDTPAVPEPGETPENQVVVVKYPDGTQKEIPTTISSIYAPQIIAITTPRNIVPEAAKGIANLNKGKGYPTSVTWKTAPDVSKLGSTEATAIVEYGNGNQIEVQLPLTVIKGDSETYSPQPTAKPVPVPQNSNDIDPSSVIDPGTLPTNPKDKPTITWTDPAKKPDLTKPGTQPADVAIKYPDGTVDHVKGHVTIEAAPEIGSISTDQGVIPDLTKSENTKQVVKNLNNGMDKPVDGYPSNITWDKEPDLSKPGVATGRITIAYPDGYKVTKDISINVTGTTTSGSSAEPGSSSTSTPGSSAEPGSSSTSTPGSSAEPSSSSTSTPGSSAEPGSSSTSTPGSSAEPSSSSTTTPSSSAEPGSSSTSTPSSSAEPGSSSTTTPSSSAEPGSSSTSTPSSSAEPGSSSTTTPSTSATPDSGTTAQPGNTPQTDAQTYPATPRLDAHTVVDKTPEPSTMIAGELPQGTTVDWVKKPDTTKAGKTSGEVKVTYPDGSSLTITVPLTVDKPQQQDADKYKPVIVPIDTKAGQVPSPSMAVKNQETLPAGTKVAWLNEPSIPETTGKSITGKLVITYPDSSQIIKQVVITTTRNGGSDAENYQPMVKTPLMVTINHLPQASEVITNIDQLPTGPNGELPKVSWVSVPAISEKAGAKTSGQITVTYPDGTSDQVEVILETSPTVAKQTDADKFVPQRLTNADVQMGQTIDPAELISNAQDLPAGTMITWANRDKVNTDFSMAGTYTETITVKYPDGSSSNVDVLITVHNNAAVTQNVNRNDAPEKLINNSNNIIIEPNNGHHQLTQRSVAVTKTSVEGQKPISNNGQSSKKLPQTGNSNDKLSALAGLSLATITGLLGLLRRNKKQNY
ncbi:YSIRK-type signal peptide-containing protein [Limosilactobacillus sp. RRLNB_1_1]|uniref:YSIRK-type signal peptide-containing protein n=3 Tax=Limosilactobacillus albertensis TaxID=2759752 RepID=A0A7W3TS14_9LACO|nr:Rib/alpha-like domain-containing protein [Limosilactobacillus albertensis]MBB1069810.1 YSIRK-type signal peptide-containing protein [Limosilactobacillus albertensis]MCD7128652.1 YPDG domain-containing protein [Limosilactobacillus albertensis]